VPSSPRTAPRAQPRARRRNGTRGPANSEALLAAAERLVVEHGENFTTQDLIREAGVALQTFYRHFGGKDQLLVAVVGRMIAGHCERLEVLGTDIDDPVERLHRYVVETLSVLGQEPGASGARFMTSQHWRLHQLYPVELAEATKPFTDLVQRELETAGEAGLLASRHPERDAWMINKLVVAVFHHYAYVDDDLEVATVTEEVWQFCLAAVGGAPRA
jgi:TetR/AcrR family transcriptional regulator